jgi:hypothetical protein
VTLQECVQVPDDELVTGAEQGHGGLADMRVLELAV